MAGEEGYTLITMQGPIRLDCESALLPVISAMLLAKIELAFAATDCLNFLSQLASSARHAPISANVLCLLICT